MELEVPPSAGRMWATAEGESGGSGGGKGDKRLFPRERGSLLTTRQMVRNQVMRKDHVMVRNLPCQAGGSHSGWDDGSEPSPQAVLMSAPHRSPTLAPRHIGTTVQTQPGCQFRRRMLLDLAVAGTSPCPGGCHSVMVTEEGKGQKGDADVDDGCWFGDADVERAPFLPGPNAMGPLSPLSSSWGSRGGSS